jgi:ABC-2 type transport system permease protein
LAALPFGLSVNIGGLFIALLLYAVIAIAMASLSYSFALIYKNEDNLAPTLNSIMLPLSLLSGIILPLALAPLWIKDLAKLNPFAYAVNAARALFIGNFHTPDIIEGFVIIILLAVLIFWWAMSSLRKMTK